MKRFDSLKSFDDVSAGCVVNPAFATTAITSRNQPASAVSRFAVLHLAVSERDRYSHVAAILRNRRLSVAAVYAAYGDGNSGYLKWVGNPFQITDAIPRVVPRIFYNSLSNGCREVVGWLSFYCKHISSRTIRQPFDNELTTIRKPVVNHRTTICQLPGD